MYIDKLIKFYLNMCSLLYTEYTVVKLKIFPGLKNFKKGGGGALKEETNGADRTGNGNEERPTPRRVPADSGSDFRLFLCHTMCRKTMEPQKFKERERLFRNYLFLQVVSSR